MSNSSLVQYKKISPNKTHPRNHVIDTITIHCMAGQLTAESCGAVFQNSSAQASSNYGVGKDGKIGMYVEECDRSWATSDKPNDHRAVTIEVASDKTHPYAVTDAAYKSMIKLVVDICKRNGIKKLIWSNNKTDRVNHLNGCNMTVHRDYSPKSCPGEYLYSRMGQIAEEVNKQLNPVIVINDAPKDDPEPDQVIVVDGKVVDASTVNNTTTATSATTKAATTSASTKSTAKTPTYTETPADFQVKVIVDDLNIRKYPSADNATSPVVGKVQKNIVYNITATSGVWGKLKSGAGWINVSAKYCTKIEKKVTVPKVTLPSYKAHNNYTLQTELPVRTGPGDVYRKKTYNEISAGAKKNDRDKDGALDAGTVVTCQATKLVGNDIWMQIPSGWIPAFYKNVQNVK